MDDGVVDTCHFYDTENWEEVYVVDCLKFRTQRSNLSKRARIVPISNER